jgi:hypothetical protein
MTENPLKDSVLCEGDVISPVTTDGMGCPTQRCGAAREMDALRASMPEVSSDEVANWIREDREQGH